MSHIGIPGWQYMRVAVYPDAWMTVCVPFPMHMVVYVYCSILYLDISVAVE